jgi:serine/threonine-protein kinase HipA
VRGGRGLRLEVRVSGVFVGVLDRERDDAVRFLPDASWVAGGTRPQLGLAFLTDPTPRRARGGLPAWFENLLPERGSTLRRRICADQALRDGQSVKLLGLLGGLLPGAVEVVGEPDDEGAEDESDPLRASVPPVRLKVALTGMQLKLSMVLSHNRFVLPASSDRGTWIVKLPGANLPDLPEVEAATLAWARHLGHPVPRIRTPPLAALEGLPTDLQTGPPTVFAIERFDRREDGTRVHQEDLCQVLEIDPKHKYGNTGPARASYDGIGRLIRDACGDEEAAEFVRRLAFVVASGNGDAHLKNWTLQWGSGGRPRLSPCYDLVADISWPDFGWGRSQAPTLALTLGRARYLNRLDRDAVDQFAARSQIPDAKAVFLHALEQARTHYGEIEDRAPARMRDALELHWRAVPLLRAFGPLRARR